MKFRNSSLFDSFPVFLCRIPLVFFPIVNGKKSMKVFRIFVPVSFCKHGSRCYGHIFTVTFNNTKVRNISVFFKTVTVDNDVSGAYFQLV